MLAISRTVQTLASTNTARTSCQSPQRQSRHPGKRTGEAFPVVRSNTVDAKAGSQRCLHREETAAADTWPTRLPPHTNFHNRVNPVKTKHPNRGPWPRTFRSFISYSYSFLASCIHSDVNTNPRIHPRHLKPDIILQIDYRDRAATCRRAPATRPLSWCAATPCWRQRDRADACVEAPTAHAHHPADLSFSFASCPRLFRAILCIRRSTSDPLPHLRNS